MKNPKVPLPSPVSEINTSIVSKILMEAWLPKYFNKITEYSDCKDFYNSCYNIALKKLNAHLDQLNTKNLILEAAKQLELWTIVQNDYKDHFDIKAPTQFAPPGRYGWRYIIEVSLEKLQKEPQDETKRYLQEKDLEIIFTLIFVAINCAEISNYLHFLSTFLTSTSVTFDIKMVLGYFNIENPKEKKGFTDLREYISFAPSKTKYKQFQPSIDNPTIRESIDEMLKIHYNCNTSLLEDFIRCVHIIANELSTLIIVSPLDNFIELILERTSLSLGNIEGILRLILLRNDHPEYQNRNLLTKSQHYRLLNYSGLILNIDDDFNSIYDPKSAEEEFVKKSKQHVIISGIMLSDWLSAFTLRVLFGQRTDLKSISPELKKAIIKIEDTYHKSIFEKETLNLFKRRNFKCLPNLKKVNNKDIPCGEIDGIAYHQESGILVILEMKNLVPSIDGRSMGQIISDHFKNKKYHDKFQKKIKYVTENIEMILNLIGLDSNSTIKEIRSYFITNTGNVTKFMVKEYLIMRYDELDKLLSNEFE